jgi:hypothetical protein
MEEHFAWMTTRRIKPGTLTRFERAWRPDTHPDGMLRAYAYWSEDEQQILGVSFLGFKGVVRCVAGHPPRKSADVRRWLPMSLMSRKRSTEAAS